MSENYAAGVVRLAKERMAASGTQTGTVMIAGADDTISRAGDLVSLTGGAGGSGGTGNGGAGSLVGGASGMGATGNGWPGLSPAARPPRRRARSIGSSDGRRHQPPFESGEGMRSH